MPGCPHCGRHWPDGYERCPDDGASLYPHAYGNAAPELAPQNDEDLAIGSVAGEYRIEKKLGEGGMGSVYGARHPVIGKRAAIKVIRRELSTSRDAVDRFVLEAQSVNQIGHPNIVDVFGFGQLHDGRSFFVMEWLDGESLRERLQRPLQFPEALELLEQIAKALEAAHDAGVVHRDLKPDNVYLASRKGEKPHVKLLDFGLAKLTGTNDNRFDRTRTGVVMGTPLYLSPEQAKGQKIDASTDIYSLGAMAYEMLSGQVPFKADSAVEIMAMHISAPAQPLMQRAPWVPREIDHLVMTMLAKDPRQRPTTAQVRQQLGTCRTTAGAVTIGIHMSPGSQPPGSNPPGSNPPWQQLQPATTPQPYLPGVPTAPPYGHAPAVGAGSHPPTAVMSPPSTPMVSMSPSAGGGSKRAVIWLVLLAVVGAGIGVALFVVLGNKKQAAKVAESETPSQVEVAPMPSPPEAASPAQPPTQPPEAKSPPAETPPAGTPPSAEPPPAADKPPADKPAADKPAADKPAADNPAADKPATDKAAADKPAADKPAADKADVAMKRVRRTGRVVVTIKGASKAIVLVDGKPQGREAAGRVTLELAPGEHTVRAQAKGMKPAETKIRVEAGGSRDVTLTLEKSRSVNAVEDPFAE